MARRGCARLTLPLVSAAVCLLLLLLYDDVRAGQETSGVDPPTTKFPHHATYCAVILLLRTWKASALSPFPVPRQGPNTLLFDTHPLTKPHKIFQRHLLPASPPPRRRRILP